MIVQNSVVQRDQWLSFLCCYVICEMEKTIFLLPRLKHFNDHQSHNCGSCIFGYNSAPAAAREVFKPSTDSASLVVSSKKKFSV